MAGLLAAGMLRKDCASVMEAQSGLPKNHSAVLRFRSSIVGDTLNIPFKKVKAVRAIQPWKNPIADIMAYSLKTNGDYTLRSIANADAMVVDRYIAPPDFVERMAATVIAPIVYDQKVGGLTLLELAKTAPVISTLPMPTLMGLLDWPGQRPEFRSVRGVNITATIAGADLYCSLYVPDPHVGAYRLSMNGDQLIVEIALHGNENTFKPEQDIPHYLQQALVLLGIDAWKVISHGWSHQRFMKILPIDEGIRQRFIIWASDTHNIYSLGRFATWRPGLLLDDIVNDVRAIQHIVKNGSYSHRLTPRSE